MSTPPTSALGATTASSEYEQLREAAQAISKVGDKIKLAVDQLEEEDKAKGFTTVMGDPLIIAPNPELDKYCERILADPTWIASVLAPAAATTDAKERHENVVKAIMDRAMGFIEKDINLVRQAIMAQAKAIYNGREKILVTSQVNVKSQVNQHLKEVEDSVKLVVAYTEQQTAGFSSILRERDQAIVRWETNVRIFEQFSDTYATVILRF